MDTPVKAPSTLPISFLALAEKVNKLEDLLKKHDIDIPEDLKVSSESESPANCVPSANEDRTTTTLMDLPDELLIKICSPVIRDIERPSQFMVPTLKLYPGDSTEMRVGLLLVAYIDGRLSVNQRLRRIVLGELFNSIVFSAHLGTEAHPHTHISLAESRLVISAPQMNRKSADDMSGLTSNTKHLEILVEPDYVTDGLESKSQLPLCLQGLATKLAKSSNLLPNIKCIHCAVQSYTLTKTANVKGFDAFVLEVIEAVRQWKTERRTVGYCHRWKGDKVIDGVQLWAKDVRSCMSEKSFPVVIV